MKRNILKRYPMYVYIIISLIEIIGFKDSYDYYLIVSIIQILLLLMYICSTIIYKTKDLFFYYPFSFLALIYPNFLIFKNGFLGFLIFIIIYILTFINLQHNYNSIKQNKEENADMIFVIRVISISMILYIIYCLYNV